MEDLCGEMFFLYVFLAAVLVLLLGAQGDHPGYQRRCTLTACCGDGAQNKGYVDKESNEDLCGEMFFLYVFLAAVVVLLLGARQLAATRRSCPSPENKNKGDLNYSWLPKETIQAINDSP